MTKHNPLNLPEVIYKLGQFLPLWSRGTGDTGDKYVYSPQTFLACIQVSQMWHAVLTPLLWKAYDSAAMAHWQIPLSTFVSNSHHIQYLDINVARPPTLTPEVLRDLLIVAEARHPHMTGMEWLKENHTARQLYQQLVLSTLESLTRLKTLRMSNHRVRARGGSSQLDQIFSNNPGLLELTLCDLQHFEVLDGSQPYTRITTLRLESGWTDNNKGMLQLLRRCPCLVSLVFSVDRCPATKLALSVKEHCPDLQTIAGVGSSRYDVSHVRGLTASTSG